MGARRQFTLRRILLLLVLWLWLGGCDRLSGPAMTATRSTGPDPSAPPPLATVVGDGVGLAFLGVERAERPGVPDVATPASPSLPYLMVDVSLWNAGRHGVPFSLSYFTLTDDAGHEYPIGYAKTTQGASSLLGRGQEVHGWLGFVTDAAARGFVLVYDPRRYAQRHNLPLDADTQELAPLQIALGR